MPIGPEKEKVKFTISYDENGEIVQVKAGKGCRVLKEGSGPIPAEYLINIMEDKQWVDVKTTTIIRAYTNPGCYMVIGGKNVCICCSK